MVEVWCFSRPFHRPKLALGSDQVLVVEDKLGGKLFIKGKQQLSLGAMFAFGGETVEHIMSVLTRFNSPLETV